MSVFGTGALKVECLEGFLETALYALSPSVEGNCLDAWDSALRICLQRALTPITEIQFPATYTAVRHSIAFRAVTEY